MTDNNEIEAEDAFEDTNWDEELVNLNEELDARGARYMIAINQLERLMTEWGNTVVYAEPPQDLKVGEIAISEEPKEGYIETSVGDISAIPLLGVMANIFSEILEDGPDADMNAMLENRARVIELVRDLMIEGILIANNPEWKDRFTKAVEGLS